MLGAVGAAPETFRELEICFLFRRLLGVHTEGDKKAATAQKLSKNKVLTVNRVPLNGGEVNAVKADLGQNRLHLILCPQKWEKNCPSPKS